MAEPTSELIDLTGREAEATVEVLDHAARPDREERRFGLYYLPASGVSGYVGKIPEVEVFWEHFGNDKGLLEAEYGRYDASSVLITVIDHVQCRPAGTIRVIGEPSEAGLKTLHDFEETVEWSASLDRIGEYHSVDIASNQILDIATLAVRRDYRRSQSAFAVSIALYHGLYLAALLEKKDFMIGALDDRVVDLQTSMGIPWEVVCGLPSVEFLGSPGTSPVIIDLDGVGETFGRSGEIGEMICHGEGLADDLSLPPLPLRDHSVFPPDIEFEAVADQAQA